MPTPKFRISQAIQQTNRLDKETKGMSKAEQRLYPFPICKKELRTGLKNQSSEPCNKASDNCPNDPDQNSANRYTKKAHSAHQIIR